MTALPRPAQDTLVVGDAAALMVPGAHLCRSREEACRALEVQPFAHVVADAGVESGELFRFVQERRPQATRILVGVPTSSSRAHAILPSNTPTPVAVARMKETHALLADLRGSVVGDFVAGLAHLPAMPRTYQALMQVAESRTTSLADISEIIARDPPLAAKLLQVVNSALFGAPRPVASLTQAVQLIGMDALLGLTLSAHLFASMEAQRFPSFSLDAFQQYSVRVARLARQVVPPSASSAEAFTAGLVHDVGRLVIALRHPKQCEAIAKAVAKEGVSAQELERAAFGVSHAEIGARLLLDWGIPFSLVHAVALHDRPAQDTSMSPTLLAVHAAQALLSRRPDNELDLAYVHRAGASDRVSHWRTLARAHAQLAK
jgi:HD-like signal output (HDOD) protein